MGLKPFQKEEDVPALPVMNQFYTERLIQLGAIPKDKLQDGVWYYGNYRNARFGKWNAITERFDHYRWKFGWMKASPIGYLPWRRGDLLRSTSLIIGTRFCM